MPATIIQSNETPFNRIDVDPITLDIVENALRNARNEMDAVLFRTAMSPGIREQHDAFPLIANQEGKMVVGQFGSFLHGFMQGYDGEIEDGDVFITNDPYSCNGAVSHLNDWLLMNCSTFCFTTRACRNGTNRIFTPSSPPCDWPSDACARTLCALV